MTNRKRAVLTALLFALASSSFATNGYFLHGIGTTSKAMAGATTAFPQEALDVETNPAGGVFVIREYSVSLALFSPDRQYTITGNPTGAPQTFGLTPGTVASKSKLFPMPTLGMNFRPNDRSAVTVNFTAHGGMNTDYRTDTFYGSNHTGVDLAQMFLTATYSHKLAENQSIGLSGVFAEQRFKASGLQAFAPFSSNPSLLTNNGYDWSNGFGLKVGYLARPVSGFTFGAAYTPAIKMTRLHDYSGLFAQRGRFNIPASMSAGLAYKVVEPVTVALDWQRIHYSDVPSVGNALLPNLMNAPLGSDNGAGFGWRDINVYKLGAQWKVSDEWIWRSGYSYTKQPIPPSQVLFNILAPGVVEDHFTLGCSRTMPSSPSRFNLAVMYAPPKSVRGPNPLEIPGAQNIQLKMSEFELEFGYSFGF